MNTNLDPLEEMFEERAKKPSGLEAQRHLAAGRVIPYRDRDTPKGYVMHQHPDGKIEMVKVSLGRKLA